MAQQQPQNQLQEMASQVQQQQHQHQHEHQQQQEQVLLSTQRTCINPHIMVISLTSCSPQNASRPLRFPSLRRSREEMSCNETSV